MSGTLRNSQQRSSNCASARVQASEFKKQLFHPIRRGQVLSKEICRVLGAQYLAEFYNAVWHSLLYPQALGVYLPQFTQPLSAAYSHGGRAIGPYRHSGMDAHILLNSLIA